MSAHAPVAEKPKQLSAAAFAERHERLAKKSYLSSDEAAFYLGYDAANYKNPRRAFMALVLRVGPAVLKPVTMDGSRRLFFFRRDLDELLRRRHVTPQGAL